MTDLQNKVLESSDLFKDITPSERESLLMCISAGTTAFGKGNIIWSAGDAVLRMGLVLSGEVRISMEDMEGRRNVLSVLTPPDLFGEVFALSGVPSSVTAYTDTGAEVLFLDARKVSAVCRDACGFHRQLIVNLMGILSRKNVGLNQKIQCVGQRTTREKVSAFLAMHHTRAGKNPFTVPFNRAEMADYLCVDRSALSLVLAQMQEEKLITFNKNEFRILGSTD